MTTPVRRQYLHIKRQYPDAIVFFRLGDFYETFDEDAEIVARVCDVVLTSRPIGPNERVPLAGVPYHSADTHIARLVKAGHKVAIVEQVGGGVSSHLRSGMSHGGVDGPPAPPTVRGLVHREVTRVVTPGTVVEPSLLDAARNNYLAACVLDRHAVGLAYVDVSTGEFAATQVVTAEPAVVLGEELARLQPAELLVPASQADQIPTAAASSPVVVTACDAWRFDFEAAYRTLLQHFEVATLDGFGLEGKTLAVRAAGVIVHYLSETQQGVLANLTRIVTVSPGEYMTLDAATRRNLEITQTIRTGSVNGSLLGVLDLTVTPMGARQLRQWLLKPLLSTAAINARLDAVEALVRDAAARAALRSHLKRCVDLERLANRAIQGIIRPRELLALAQTLRVIPALASTLSASGSSAHGGASRSHVVEDSLRAPAVGLASIAAALDPCSDAADLIEQAIADEPPATAASPGTIRRGFSSELDEVLHGAREAREWIAGLEARERQRTGIKSLKVGYNKVFGYYIEVSKSNLSGVPSDYIRKQTIVNGERYITPELKEYESRVLNAEERQIEIEIRVYREVCARVAALGPRLLATARALAALDTYLALAEVAVRNDYVRPEITEDTCLEIIAGRHPVVERSVTDHAAAAGFVPNDVRMSAEQSILVITGPNMSGKSTYLRQVALICLMAHIGSFVPARQARIGLVDRIFTRIGAEDIIHAGQSTFMVEMVETANILHHATPRSLLILDEIGRGTSTYDGLSIAWAVVEHIHNEPRLRARTLFATHYHELTALADLLPRVANYNVAVSEEGGRVVFLHRIVPGGADRSYGIHVAQLAGLPRAVIQRAREILTRLEQADSGATGTLTPSTGRSTPTASVREAPPARQLSLFGDAAHPALEALRQIDINSLTPLEAISRLYELQRLANDQTSGA
jgi:DNA mismatch repair protein MutS